MRTRKRYSCSDRMMNNSCSTQPLVVVEFRISAASQHRTERKRKDHHWQIARIKKKKRFCGSVKQYGRTCIIIFIRCRALAEFGTFWLVAKAEIKQTIQKPVIHYCPVLTVEVHLLIISFPFDDLLGFTFHPVEQLGLSD